MEILKVFFGGSRVVDVFLTKALNHLQRLDADEVW